MNLIMRLLFIVLAVMSAGVSSIKFRVGGWVGNQIDKIEETFKEVSKKALTRL